MIFFLASLPEEEYVIVNKIFDLFQSCDIKDQKLSRSQRGSLINSKLDCKGVNFKPLRGLASKSRKELLLKVRNHQLSFPELSTSCKYIKKMTDVKTQFMRYLNVSSWELAEETYPAHTKEEKLQPFLEMSFKNDTLPPLFQAFCKQAKCSTISPQESTQPDCSSSDNMVLKAGNPLWSFWAVIPFKWRIRI